MMSFYDEDNFFANTEMNKDIIVFTSLFLAILSALVLITIQLVTYLSKEFFVLYVNSLTNYLYHVLDV